MRKLIVVLVLIFAGFWGCSSEYETSLTLKNLAAGAVYLNFRGEVTKVPAGQTVVIKKLPKGSYIYATTYEIPAGATQSSAEGDVEGEFTFKAGSKILVLYSSTFIDDKYTLYASRTSNDNLDDQRNPLFP